MAYDFRRVEKKWRKRWDAEKAFESSPDDRPKFYITVAYPYPSGGMHVGHARTYTVPDIFARYKRMQGFNVLFPMGWHVTGTPIIGAVNRLKEKEAKQMKVLRDVYHIKDSDLKKMDTPMNYARYFIENHYQSSMSRMGYVIDWRRQFTTNDPQYNSFITWQYDSLHKNGLVVEGKHPVKYCIEDKNPVTTHDLLEGEEAEIQEWTLIKFKFGDAYIIAATLRPETMYGQTNMWVNPEVHYIKAKVKSGSGESGDAREETWIISKECAEKLRYQDMEVEEIGKIKGADMIGKTCHAPAVDRDIIILPSTFPDPKVATGLVTSVPSDAPYDYVALRDLQEDEKLCKKYKLDWNAVKKIQVIPIITTKKYGDNAALKLVNEMNIKNQKEADKLEEATKEIYKEGFHTGVMNDNCGPYKGMRVEVAKEAMKQDLIDQGIADVMHEFSEPVKCRCGGKVVVAKVDSWFLKYSDDEWKAKTRGAVNQLDCVPENTKNEYFHTIDWLKDWPCIRNFGLGTKLPFDDRFIIEPLSDSTIYMSYYTIAHLIKKYNPEQLKGDFFNFIFMSQGKIEAVSKSTKIPVDELDEIKKSFEYWYPLDWRCSASELIGNHLTFMLFHHTALFSQPKWPLGIVAFGVGLLEGAKMSSSKGNVVLLSDALDRYGADVVRLFLMSNADPWQDFDWRDAEVIGVQKALGRFMLFVEHALKAKEAELTPLDKWLLSKKERMILEVRETLDKFQTRKALQAGFFEVFNTLRWYERRGGKNGAVLKEFLDTWVRILAPFTPYLAEEIWGKIGGEGLVLDAEYPSADMKKINDKAEAGERVIEGLVDDVYKIINVTKKKPKECALFIAPPEKFELFDKIQKGAQIKDIMQDAKFRAMGKDVVNMFKKSQEMEVPQGWSPKDEAKLLESARAFLEAELGCSVTVNPKEDPGGKRRFALPTKPAIFLA